MKPQEEEDGDVDEGKGYKIKRTDVRSFARVQPYRKKGCAVVRPSTQIA